MQAAPEAAKEAEAEMMLARKIRSDAPRLKSLAAMVPKGRYFYLATPYSKYPDGLDAAFRDACRATATLISAGVPVFSPIAHTHPVAVYGKMDPLDHSIWLPADKPMMDAAFGLLVARLDTWELSYGIKVEINEFIATGKPVIHLEKDELL
jgi:hypothetical protein